MQGTYLCCTFDVLGVARNKARLLLLLLVLVLGVVRCHDCYWCLLSLGLGR